jgi:hypothetical protein
VEKSGMLNPYCGGKLRERIEEMDFTEVMAVGTFPINRGGDSYAKLLLRNTEIFKSGLISTRELNEQDFHRWGILMENPSLYYVGVPAVAAWGKKPNN